MSDGEAPKMSILTSKGDKLMKLLKLSRFLEELYESEGRPKDLGRTNHYLMVRFFDEKDRGMKIEE